MLCDFCHQNEAVLFIEQATKTFSKKLHVCMDCAVKNGISPDPQKIQKTINNLFDAVAKTDTTKEIKAEKLCRVCGKSFSSIKKYGKVGCAECYESFKIDLPKLLSRHGIKGTYTGSMPKRLSTFRSVLTDRIDLEAKLEQSIKSEDYEKAAIYRDYLRALERSSVSDGSDIEDKNE